MGTNKEELFQYYILFPNHHQGLKAHKLLKEAGIKCTISPTPREASHSCGICLMLDEQNAHSAEALLGSSDIITEGMVKLPRRKNTGYRSC